MDRVLLIEDDPVIGDLVAAGFREARYHVDRAVDGAVGLASALNEEYQLIVLDLQLPKRDGWSVCSALRERAVSTPILILTARDAVEDRVRGLNLGADDYLCKPFEFQELLARAKALLRRDKQHRAAIIRIGDLEIDTGSATVRRGRREIRLTRREFTLLEALAANEGRVLTREAILDRVWMDEDSFSDTVKVHIMALRKKIDDGEDVKLIHTVRGLGYLLRRPHSEGD